MNPISIGNEVADFEALSTGNKTIKLTDYRGRYVVIYFSGICFLTKIRICREI